LTQQVVRNEDNSTELSQTVNSKIRELILQSMRGKIAILPDIFNARLRSKYSYADFLNAFRNLKSEGFIAGIGDGFAVHYSLTKKGLEELDSEKSSYEKHATTS
jgi:hypothetical protein